MGFSKSASLIFYSFFYSLFYEIIILLIIYMSISITVVISKKSHQLQGRQKVQSMKYVLNKFQISECRRFLIHSVRVHFFMFSVAELPLSQWDKGLTRLTWKQRCYLQLKSCPSAPYTKNNNNNKSISKFQMQGRNYNSDYSFCFSRPNTCLSCLSCKNVLQFSRHQNQKQNNWNLWCVIHHKL